MRNILFGAFNWTQRRLAGTGLGRVPGMKAVYEAIYGMTRPRDVVMIEAQGSKMFINPGETIHHRDLMLRGVADRGQTDLFRSLVRPHMVVVDIGANVGYYTLIAAHTLRGTGRVYAFEPDSNNHSPLMRSVQANGYANVVAERMGMTEKAGRRRLFMHRESGLCHSFAKGNVGDSSESVEVETTSLDEYFGGHAPDRRVDLIKMDAECAEGLIISGGRRVLSDDRLIMLMELNAVKLPNMGTDPKQLVDSLVELGFQVNLIDDDTGKTRPITASEAVGRSLDLGGHIELLLRKPGSAAAQ